MPRRGPGVEGAASPPSFKNSKNASGVLAPPGNRQATPRMAIGSDLWRSTASSLAFTRSNPTIAFCIRVKLEGGCELTLLQLWGGGGIARFPSGVKELGGDESGALSCES
jgi:hypothetical protein